MLTVNVLNGFNEDEKNPISVRSLIVGGGGASGSAQINVSYPFGGGGGEVLDNTTSLFTGTSYSVQIGAGGDPIGGDNVAGTDGTNSVFHTFTARGGSGGGRQDLRRGGRSGNTLYVGGQGGTDRIGTPGSGGGGGNSGNGSDGFGSPSSYGGQGGAGTSSNITGSTIGYGGGGGGGGYHGGGSGQDGGGDGVSALAGPGSAGAANRGGGGGSAWVGGSGVVILRYPNTFTLFLSGTLSATTTTVSSDKVTTITSGAGNITFK